MAKLGRLDVLPACAKALYAGIQADRCGIGEGLHRIIWKKSAIHKKNPHIWVLVEYHLKTIKIYVRKNKRPSTERDTEH
jgi:hypothetical protein